MSELDPNCKISNSQDCPKAKTNPGCELLDARLATLGENITIRRVLPHPKRRMIGAWCFWDHFGPIPLSPQSGLNIGPHPHIGLQTLTWLAQGQILHRDSLGSEQLITPGKVNLMTAGFGISHSEESVDEPSKELHGVQLWIALPDSQRNGDAAFHHYAQVPSFNHQGIQCKLFAGSAMGYSAPTQVYSPLMGLDLQVMEDVDVMLPLNQGFEHGLLTLNQSVVAQQEVLSVGKFLYINQHTPTLHLQAPKGTHLILLGGEPFKEEILIWWNFVARNRDEIAEATMQWFNQKRFGEVKGYQGDRLKAPSLS